MNSELRYKYLHGACAVLAVAVQGRTGWPLFRLAYEGNLWTSWHVVARTPGGRYVDALGLHEDWREITLFPYTCAPDRILPYSCAWAAESWERAGKAWQQRASADAGELLLSLAGEKK